MPWTTPTDRTTGYVVTATDWNIVEDNLTFLYGDTGWTTMSGFTNGWTNVGGVNTARYRLVGTFVTIQGVVTGGTVTTAIFTLPAGYRPSNTIGFAATNGATTLAAFTITSAGVITQTAGTNSNLHLSCTFSTL